MIFNMRKGNTVQPTILKFDTSPSKLKCFTESTQQIYNEILENDLKHKMQTKDKYNQEPIKDKNINILKKKDASPSSISSTSSHYKDPIINIKSDDLDVDKIVVQDKNFEEIFQNFHVEDKNKKEKKQLQKNAKSFNTLQNFSQKQFESTKQQNEMEQGSIQNLQFLYLDEQQMSQINQQPPSQKKSLANYLAQRHDLASVKEKNDESDENLSEAQEKQNLLNIFTPRNENNLFDASSPIAPKFLNSSSNKFNSISFISENDVDPNLSTGLTTSNSGVTHMLNSSLFSNGNRMETTVKQEQSYIQNKLNYKQSRHKNLQFLSQAFNQNQQIQQQINQNQQQYIHNKDQNNFNKYQLQYQQMFSQQQYEPQTPQHFNLQSQKFSDKFIQNSDRSHHQVSNRSFCDDALDTQNQMNQIRQNLFKQQYFSLHQTNLNKNIFDLQQLGVNQINMQTPKGRKKQIVKDEDLDNYYIQIDKIEQDPRTTLYIKNIPNKYTQELLLETINQKNFGADYDFFYLPIDFNNKANIGYAFINFLDKSKILRFYLEFNGKKWEKFNSDKICIIRYARLQGRHALQEHFEKSSVMNQQDQKLRPLIILPKNNLTNIGLLIKQQKKDINH